MRFSRPETQILKFRIGLRYVESVPQHEQLPGTGNVVAEMVLTGSEAIGRVDTVNGYEFPSKFGNREHA